MPQTKQQSNVISDAELWDATQLARYKAKKNGLLWFYKNIFIESFKPDEFKSGWHPHSLIEELDGTLRFMLLLGRNHGKSYALYCINAYLAFITEQTVDPAFYISGSTQSAARHLRNFNRIIDSNFWFKFMTNRKSATTESIFSRQWDDNSVFEMASMSIFSRQLRGPRSSRLFFDDVYSKQTLDEIQTAAAIDKVNDRVLGDAWGIWDPGPGAMLGFAGTTLAENDLFHNQKFIEAVLGVPNQGKFIKRPALKKDGTPVWPERFSQAKHDELVNTLGQQTYDREYNLKTPITTDSRIDSVALKACIDPSLPHLKRYTPENQEMSFMTWDPSTEGRHASHMAVWKIDTSNRITQVASIWIDNQDITAQIALCNRAWTAFKISRGWADNGGGPLTHANNAGNLPNGLELIKPTLQLKGDMMGALDIRVNNQSIKFIDDDRQYRSILMMGNDLKARQVGNDHGEASFTSGFACLYIQPSSKPFVVVGRQF